MPVVFFCRGCKVITLAVDELRGRRIRCKKCDATMDAPSGSDPKAVARSLARAYWRSPAAESAKSNGGGICDYCNGSVAIEAGFLTPPIAADDVYPSMACGTCFGERQLLPWDGDISRMPRSHASAFEMVASLAHRLKPPKGFKASSKSSKSALVLRNGSNDALKKLFDQIGLTGGFQQECDRCRISMITPGPATLMLVMAGISRSPESVAAALKLLQAVLGPENLEIPDAANTSNPMLFGLLTGAKLVLVECENCKKLVCPACKTVHCQQPGIADAK